MGFEGRLAKLGKQGQVKGRRDRAGTPLQIAEGPDSVPVAPTRDRTGLITADQPQGVKIDNLADLSGYVCIHAFPWQG
jgi:hypothetical protein